MIREESEEEIKIKQLATHIFQFEDMSWKKTIGKLKEKKITEEKEVYWEIPNFLSLSTTSYYAGPDVRFLNTTWRLRIDPSEFNSKCIEIFLAPDDCEFTPNLLGVFGIRKADGSLVGVKAYSLVFRPRTFDCFRVEKFFNREDLERNKSELLPHNNLIIMISLKNLNDSMQILDLNTFSEDIKSLYTARKNCDVALQLKGKELQAHKIILSARSPVFAAMFKHEMSEKRNGVIKIPDCDPESFEDFLEYLYSGKLETMSTDRAVHLYVIADKYDVPELKIFCAEYIGKNLKIEYFCDAITLAENFNETELFSCEEFFYRNLKHIFKLDEWKFLMKNNSDLVDKLLLGMASKIKIVD